MEMDKEKVRYEVRVVNASSILNKENAISLSCSKSNREISFVFYSRNEDGSIRNTNYWFMEGTKKRKYSLSKDYSSGIRFLSFIKKFTPIFLVHFYKTEDKDFVLRKSSVVFSTESFTEFKEYIDKGLLPRISEVVKRTMYPNVTEYTIWKEKLKEFYNEVQD